MTEGKSLFKKLTRALFKSEGGDAAHPLEETTGKSREEETWVALALDELLKKQPRARLQVISLAEYRTAIGEAWETRANTIRMLSESTIRSHLTQGESCLPYGEDVFIMLMPGADQKESAKRAYDAALQLGQRLVGDKFTTGKAGGVVPQVRLASMALSEMVNADGRVEVSGVLAAAEKAVAVKKETAGEKPKAASEGRASTDQWRQVAHDKQSRPVEMMPIQPVSGAQKKKADINWAPIVKDKG